MTRKFLYQLNKLCAVLFVVWVCWPWLGQNTGLIGSFLISMGWCLTAVAVNGRYTTGIDGVLMAFYVVYMLLSFLLTGRVYADYQLYYHLSMVTLFFLPYYMMRFYHRKGERTFMGRLAIVAVIFMIVGCITSSYYTRIDENIMKTISQAMDTELVQYRKLGIGSFGFVYMVMLSIIGIVGLLKANSSELKIRAKVLLIVMGVVGVKCVVDSTFTTAILLLVLGVILVFSLSDRSPVRNFLICLIAIPGVFLMTDVLGRFLSSLQMESADVTVRLNELGALLQGEGSGDNIASRLKYFKHSIDAFLESPLLGYNFAINPLERIGSHSEWIDIFAIYGLIGGIPLLCSIIIKLKNTRAMAKEFRLPYYGLLTLIFVIYGFVDPFLRLYHLGFAMFFLLPCIGCMSDVLQKEEDPV